MTPIYQGMPLRYDPNVLRHTDERLFPFSKNRSKRIEKKLIKRHGGVYRRVPAIIRLGGAIVAHPSFKAEIERQIAKATP